MLGDEMPSPNPPKRPDSNTPLAHYDYRVEPLSSSFEDSLTTLCEEQDIEKIFERDILSHFA